MRLNVMTTKLRLSNTGFSLLELLLALGILGVIAVFALSISHSTRNLAKAKNTRNTMLEIKRAALDYYSGHRDLPAPSGSNEVPVGTSALNLEQKHRLDTWGRYFHYDRAVAGSRTDITGLTVDGKAVAAVIISGGPDQTLEATNGSSPYSTAGDDIVLAVSLAEQAFAIAADDLQVLQSKVQAFDKMFAGIDNNSSSVVDEDGCSAVLGCPQTATNDPNCGTATLDAISFYGACGYPVTSAAVFISSFYGLGSTVLLDPWLNNYVWGKPPACGLADACYHKFFSYGPDGALGGGDDIIP
ncbi:prepilin-type N-terminal cleavage/methylation domain-containing protein [Thermodesulfobacteriota bacterium]